mgnify:CR=1 FL=1
MQFNIRVNKAWILLVHKAVEQYLVKWPGGDPEEQQAFTELKADLDKLALEVMFES